MSDKPGSLAEHERLLAADEVERVPCELRVFRLKGARTPYGLTDDNVLVDAFLRTDLTGEVPVTPHHKSGAAKLFEEIRDVVEDILHLAPNPVLRAVADKLGRARELEKILRIRDAVAHETMEAKAVALVDEVGSATLREFKNDLLADLADGRLTDEEIAARVRKWVR